MNVRTELVPLSDRLGALQGIRLLLAGVVIAALTLLDQPEGRRTGALILLSIGFVLLTAVIELWRRAARRRALVLVWWLLLLDGLFLAIVLAETGVRESPLVFLVYLHIVASVLLTSFRNGAAVAVWHALLLAFVDRGPWFDATRSAPFDELLLLLGSFVLVAGATTACCSLNERALRRNRKAAADLAALGTELEHCRRVDDVARVAVGHLRSRLGFRQAALLVHCENAWSGATDAGRGPALLESDAPLRAAGVVPDDGPLLVADLADVDAPLLEGALPGATNVVLLALPAESGVVGLLAVEIGAGHASVGPADLELLERSAARLALSVRTVRLLGEVERLAASDPLTGLPNRRAFDADLQRELARARRSGAPFSLALLDVDHFKLVNDEHGHQAGDDVLRELATALLGAVRQESLVARYGGEEFVVLLPEATPEEAMVAVERLRAAAARVQTVPVTVSAGLASLADITSEPGGEGEALLRAADRALYRAKADGRDRTFRYRHWLDTEAVLA